MKTEALVTISNRVVGPIAIFSATAVLSRTLETAEFTSFLLALSLAQWALQFGFQWIKNGILKTVHSRNFWVLTLSAFAISSISVTAFAVRATWQESLYIGAAISLFTMSNGAFYVVATTSRLSGNIIKPQLFEIMAVSTRWVLGCYVCITTHNIAYLFLAMALVNAVYCLPLIVNSFSLDNNKDRFGLGPYFKISIALVLTDTAASTFMYLDRFIVKEADYLIYSTLGNQAASVLMGAAMAIFLPRLARKYHAGENWGADHQKYFGWLLGVAGITIIGSWIFAPLAIMILSPDTPAVRFEVVCFAAAQSLHFVFMFVTFKLLLIGKNWVTAVCYAVAALAYAVILISYKTLPTEYLPLFRIGVLLMLTLAGFLVVNRFFRKVD